MTQSEISAKLTRLKFVGLYSYSRLAKESGLSTDTIRKAMAGTMSARTQTRIGMLLKQLPEQCERPPKKNKPGHKKRFLIRYLNLRYWISEIEEVCGKNPRFKLRRNYDLSTSEKAGYVCTKLDFMLKTYVMQVFGAELQKRKVFMGDCYAVEQWIERIAKILPNTRKDLLARLQKRRGINEHR